VSIEQAVIFVLLFTNIVTALYALYLDSKNAQYQGYIERMDEEKS